MSIPLLIHIQTRYKVDLDRLQETAWKALMLQGNPERMDYYRKYVEIVADYNREKDRVNFSEFLSRPLAANGASSFHCAYSRTEYSWKGQPGLCG